MLRVAGRRCSGAAVASLLSAGLFAFGMSGLQRDGRDTESSRESLPTPADHGNMAAVWLICSVAVVFWLTTQQAGTRLPCSQQ